MHFKFTFLKKPSLAEISLKSVKNDPESHRFGQITSVSEKSYQKLVFVGDTDDASDRKKLTLKNPAQHENKTADDNPVPTKRSEMTRSQIIERSRNKSMAFFNLKEHSRVKNIKSKKYRKSLRNLEKKNLKKLEKMGLKPEEDAEKRLIRFISLFFR